MNTELALDRQKVVSGPATFLRFLIAWIIVGCCTELLQEMGLYKIGSLHRGFQPVAHLPWQINGVDLEDASIGIMVGHRPDRRDEH